MYKKYFLLFLFCLLHWQALWAVMAYPFPVDVELPDGSRLEIQLHGDEFFNYTTDRNGYIIAQKTDGFYYYADYDNQGKLNIGNHKAGTQVATRSAQIPEFNLMRAAQTRSSRYEASRELTRANASQAYEGRLKTLVLLVAFQDKAFVSPTANNDFYRLKNELGYSDNGATGSVRDYYRDNSNGVFDPEFVVMGPYTLSKPMSHYGDNNAAGNDQNPREMVIEAAWLAEQEGVDFSEFDENNDGFVDIIYVYYAGHNEAEGGPAASIWPHSWSVASMDSTTLDGVNLGYYACSSELKGSKGATLTAIGTACHEYAHTLGLMDMYDTDGTSSGGRAAGLGSLSLMSAGNYNNQSRTPPYLTSEERWSLGWMTPTTISEGGEYTLASINQNQAYVMHTTTLGEYFLFENRQPTKWDAYLQGKGLLIYHVDKSLNQASGKSARLRWYENSVNVSPQHQCMDLEEAAGTESRGDAFAFFPGSVGAYSRFTKSSAPAAMAWSGMPLGIELHNISLNGEEISFSVVKEDKVFFGGQVIDLQDQPISDAGLFLRKLDEESSSGSTGRLRAAMRSSRDYFSTVSTGDGRFMFEENLIPGKYELFCQSGNFANFSKIIDLKPGSNDVTVLLMSESDRFIQDRLSWCEDFIYAGAVGSQGESFMAGAKWTAEELNQYTGMYIGRMSFFIATGEPLVKVYIYSDGKLIYSKIVPAAQLDKNSYCTVDLLADSLLINPGEELLLAYEVSSYGEDNYPAGICYGAGNDGKGNLISMDKGQTWTTLYQEAAIEGNWLISFFVSRGSDFVPVENFSLDPEEVSLTVGSTYYLFGNVTPSYATNGKISWQSSDTTVISVDQSGKLSALSVGESLVTATTDNGNLRAGCRVQVFPSIAVSMNIHTAQHMFFMEWTDTRSDSWELSWKNSNDSVYQDTMLIQSSFFLESLSPQSNTDVIVKAFLNQEETDRYEGKIITSKTTSSYMAINTKTTYNAGDILLLDVLNTPAGSTVVAWKLDDTILESKVLLLSAGIHDLQVEVNTPSGKEIIRRRIKVD